MRTLKKTLCLVLALVMMLGLCAINVGATDLPDDDEIGNDYREAFELANYLKIITGAEVGGQVVANPQGDMTRVQGCYYIARLLKGNYGTGTSSMFTDVSGQDAAVVEWMVAQGYTEGNGDGTFEPYNKMLGMHFAKWLLTALGYDAEAEGLTGVGDKWEGQVRLLTAKSGLTRGIEGYDQNAVLTREQAAQMVLNALEADMMAYYGTTNVTQSGLTVNIKGVAQPMTRANESATQDYRGRSGQNADNVYQLVEMYYPNLKWIDNSDDEISPFDLNRPMDHIWKDGGKEVYRVVATPKAAYGGKTQASTIIKDLSGCYIDDDDRGLYVNSVERDDTASISNIVYVNGADADSIISTKNSGKYSFSATDGVQSITFSGISVADMIADLTENGRSVEIYTTNPEDANEITAIVVNVFTVAKVKEIDENKDTTTYTFEAARPEMDVSVEAKTVAGSEKENTLITGEPLAEGDIVLLTSNCLDDELPDKADLDNLVYAYPTEKKTGEQTRYTNQGKVTIDGTVYDVATGVLKEDGTALSKESEFSSNVEVEYYLFNLGGTEYLVHAKAVEKDDSVGNYAFIVDASGELSKGFDAGVPTIKVRAVLSDGTWGDYKVATKVVKVSGDGKPVSLYVPTETDGMYEYKDKAETTATTDYTIITNTDIVVAGGTGAVSWGGSESKVTVDNAAKLLMSDLYGYVYRYTLDGDTITLKPIGDKDNEDAEDRYGGNYNDEDKKVGTVYTGQTTEAVVKGVQNYESAKQAVTDGVNYYAKPTDRGIEVDGTGVIVGIGANTKFFIYDSTDKKVTTQTGLSNISSEAGKSAYGYYVAKATSEDRLTADVVFMVKGGGVKADTGESKDYIFIKADDKTTEQNGDDKIVFFKAWNTKGELVTAFAKDADAGDIETGLYTLKTDGEINKMLLVKGDGTKVTESEWEEISKDTPYFYLAKHEDNVVGNNTWIDSGDMTPNGSTAHYWTINGLKSVNSPSDKLTEKDLYVILKTDNSGLTGDVAYIFTA